MNNVNYPIKIDNYELFDVKLCEIYDESTNIEIENSLPKLFDYSTLLKIKSLNMDELCESQLSTGHDIAWAVNQHAHKATGKPFREYVENIKPRIFFDDRDFNFRMLDCNAPKQIIQKSIVDILEKYYYQPVQFGKVDDPIAFFYNSNLEVLRNLLKMKITEINKKFGLCHCQFSRILSTKKIKEWPSRKFIKLSHNLESHLCVSDNIKSVNAYNEYVRFLLTLN